MVGAFLRWWKDELAALLPASPRRPRTPGRRLVLTLDGAGVLRTIEDHGRPLPAPGPAEPIALDALPGELSRIRDRDPRLPIGLRVRYADCFARTVDLPASAERDFARMLRLDLERTTPLKGSDVLCAHYLDPQPPGRGLVRVHHLVLKTRTIEPVRTIVRRAGADLASIDCLDSVGRDPLPVQFLEPVAAAERTWRPGRAAALATLVLALVALGTFWLRQELALARLDDEIARLEQSAADVRRSLDVARTADAGISRLRRLEEGRQPALVILEEVTKLVPDTAWLQDLRYDGNVIEISGLAVSAAALLPAFERSALFHEARFTAPIRVETGEDRERFRLEAKLRAGRPAAVTR